MRFIGHRRPATLAVSLFVCAASVAPLGRPASQRLNAGPPALDGTLETETVLSGFFKRVEEYQTALKNLTAEETRITETYKKSGALDKRRRVVSDWVVYRSSGAGAEGITEYRDVRTVDGKPVRNQGQRALRLITKAAASPSVAKELEAINHESERFDIGAKYRAFTISQGSGMARKRDDFAIDSIGHDRLDGNDAIVVAYHRKELNHPDRRFLPKEFGATGTYVRGRLWLHPTTRQLVKEVWEIVVPHPTLPGPLVRTRVEKTYVQSPYGILVPDQLVFEDRGWFSHPKGGSPRFDVQSRQTATFTSFKQFHVGTSIDLTETQ